ncbi:MAG: 50S ribosomal protein L29 [Flavobacteriales bacterium]|nr:50S ribosomal protein L29 [Flavobacteriales bacterium]MCB9191473.1 50S ribosomal protein L29 [Flavobacteriales bacterium]MCB9203901.1 50S ribosomal protein L29 [Flavobacteriales bacterium]
MENAVIRELSSEELEEKLAEERLKLAKMKMNHAVSPIENPQELKHSRRLIARLMTERTTRSKA